MPLAHFENPTPRVPRSSGTVDGNGEIELNGLENGARRLKKPVVAFCLCISISV